MSATFSLGCEDCKEHIWCAQKSAGDLRLYTTAATSQALSEFLFKHRGHRLVFDENAESERFSSWREVGPLSEDDPPEAPIPAAAHEGALFCRDLCAGLLETEERPDVAEMLRKKIAQCDDVAAKPYVQNLWKDWTPNKETK